MQKHPQATLYKFAAIDIGSNAVRLLISHLSDREGELRIHKEAMIRMPVRLGTDSFTTGTITPNSIEQLAKTLAAYRMLVEVYGVIAWKACATSALREAQNLELVLKTVRHKAGVNIEVIDGSTEAELIFNAHRRQSLHANQNMLYIDVGGGSTELTLFGGKRRLASKSFPLGTIRTLENLVGNDVWIGLREWLMINAHGLPNLTAIGTGGNINKLAKLANLKDGKPLPLKKLVAFQFKLRNMTIQQRIDQLGLRQDRADVIVPALEIYANVMHWANIEAMYVPRIGLSDGIVLHLYDQFTGR